MSDQYYDHERMPAEDPHEELHALAGTIETLPPWDDAVQPLLVEAGQLLRSVYDDAEQRGDADAMHFIQASLPLTRCCRRTDGMSIFAAAGDKLVHRWNFGRTQIQTGTRKTPKGWAFRTRGPRMAFNLLCSRNGRLTDATSTTKNTGMTESCL